MCTLSAQALWKYLDLRTVRVAYYGIDFVYRSLAMAAAAVLLCQHTRINCAVMLVIPGYDNTLGKALG